MCKSLASRSIIRFHGKLTCLDLRTNAEFVCGTLVRIALDGQIAKSGKILASIEDALCAIMSRIPEDKWPELVYLPVSRH